ncbi:MAG TPA: alpha/beta hydrolase [Ktedonobacteraceae bacterium]|nr:alpha/beta hydrolase [Ktedonobacteraceae bacterium]
MGKEQHKKVKQIERNTLYRRVWGEGERIVFIHGGGIEDPGVTWAKQRELASHYQVIVPDRRGYGQSPQREEGPWTFEDDAADIRTFLGDQAHLVGFSVGGIVALVLAGLWPTSVRSLTLIEPPAFGIALDRSEVSTLVTSLRSVFHALSTPEAFLVNFMKTLGWQPPESLRLSPRQRRGIEAMMQEPEPWELEFPLEMLATLACPKLVVSGDWHPAFVITADCLAYQLHAERLLIQEMGHAAHQAGRIFNDRLIALVQSSVQHNLSPE